MSPRSKSSSERKKSTTRKVSPRVGSASRRTESRDGSAAVKKWGPRADKGEGEAAVQARIAALAEPSRSIMARLHPLIMKHGSGLEPTVRYGFAIYMRGKAMALIAAPRKSYVSFGYPTNAGIHEEPVEFKAPDDIDEGQVAAMVRRVLA